MFANDFPIDMMYMTKVKYFTYLLLLNGHGLGTKTTWWGLGKDDGLGKHKL